LHSQFLRHLALPMLSRLTKSRYWEAYQEMLELETTSLDHLQQLQWQRFTELLGHAYANVPYYRERMQAAGVHPDDITGFESLNLLPVSTKEDVQANFPDRITAQSGDRSDWQYVSTSGTANRLMVIQDFFKRDMVRAATTRSLHLSGDYRVGKKMVEIPPDVCSIVCGAEGQVVDGVFSHIWQMSRNKLLTDPSQISSLRGQIEREWIFRKRTHEPFGSRGTNLTEEQLEGYVTSLRRDRPYVLKALPTYLYQIANYVVDAGLDPLQIDIVKPMGSSVTPGMRRTIERGFSGDYREEYGSAEFGDMACDCSQTHGLHVFTDLFLIEIVKGDRHSAPGELGRVLITDLSNRAMPLIRYEIGDVGRWLTDDHDCERKSPRLCIEGRINDTLVMPGGAAFTSDEIMDWFYSRDDVDQFQLLEKNAGHLEVLVVGRGDKKPADNGLRAELNDYLGGGMQIDVHAVKTIKPESSGKFRFVQSQSYQALP